MFDDKWLHTPDCQVLNEAYTTHRLLSQDCSVKDSGMHVSHHGLCAWLPFACVQSNNKHLDGLVVRHHCVVQCMCAQQGLCVVHRASACVMQQRHRLGFGLNPPCRTACGQSHMVMIAAMHGLAAPGSEKKRKDYAFWRQFNEKPSKILSCPGAPGSLQRAVAVCIAG